MRLRIDAISSLGVHLASVAMNEAGGSYILNSEKRYKFSQNREGLLEEVLNVRISPKILFLALFEEVQVEDGWKCERETKGQLRTCRGPLGSQVIWEERAQARRKVQVIVSHYQISLDLRAFQPNVQINPAMFELKRPPSFRNDAG